jgi:hypothetical protein
MFLATDHPDRGKTEQLSGRGGGPNVIGVGATEGKQC